MRRSRRTSKEIYSLFFGELDEFVAPLLGVRTHVAVLNEPGLELVVRPSAPEGALGSDVVVPE